MNPIKGKSTDRICLITGGARGLGRILSLELLKKGYTVIVNYLHSGEMAESLRTYGAIPFKADVSKMEDCVVMAEFVKKQFGYLNALINNAGITQDELLIKLKTLHWQEVIDVNLKGPFNMIKTFSELLSTTRGHIVNIISYSGIRGKAGQTAYSASKAGLIGLTLTSARELSPLGIKVNAVAPGYMDTEMGRLLSSAMEQAVEESLLKTLTDPDEVAQFISFLIETETITGQIFRIDSRI